MRARSEGRDIAGWDGRRVEGGEALRGRTAGRAGAKAACMAVWVREASGRANGGRHRVETPAERWDVGWRR